jgi:putative ABC transport system substrate-binding protein
LEQLGWKEGHNIRFEYRWTSGNPELIRRHAAELVASAPDLLLTGITPAVQALKRETATIPIVFANVADPVGSGLVPSLAKPGANVTGFTAVEYTIVGKWLELLKELAPETARWHSSATIGTMVSPLNSCARSKAWPRRSPSSRLRPMFATRFKSSA